MAALVEPAEMISTIISHWLSTMSYLSAPDKRPMIEIVSHCQTNGVSMQSIKGKVASSSYRSLEEFVSEFVMLIEFEREDLNSNMNPDIKTAQGGLKSVSESSKSQIYKAYGIFILEQYLEDWKSKTLDKVNNKTVTIDELYEMLERKKIRNSLLKSTKSTKTLPEEHPKRVSKRISAAQKKNKDLTFEISHFQAETEETPQPCCSYNPEQSPENYESSDEDRDIPVDSLGVDTLGINRNSPSSDLIKIPANTLDFESDDILISTNEQDFLGETSVEIFASLNDEFLETDTGNLGNESATNLSPQLEMSEAKKLKRCKSDPIQTTKFLSQLSSQGSVHKQGPSYHTEDPFDTNDEIASINLDEINISDEKPHNQTTGVISTRRFPMAPKRKRRVYFYESKKWRKEKRLAWKSGGDSKNKKFKPAELNVNTNNNNNNNINQDVLVLSKEELSDIASNGDNVDTDDKINTNNDNNNNNSSDISESSEFTLTGATTPPQKDPRSTKQKFSPIVYDLTPSPTPLKLNPYRCPVTVPIATRPPALLHGPYFVTPGVSANQYFPRYPYTTYPPTQHTPIQRFYARQRIPSIAIMGRPFPTQIRYRQQMFTPNSTFKAYPH